MESALFEAKITRYKMVKNTVGRKAKGVFYEGERLLYQKGKHHLRTAFDSILKLYTVHVSFRTFEK